MLQNIASWTSYTWFFYLGIFIFFLHILINGFTLDLSYFGLILFLIGYFKPVLYNWFINVLWFFIIIDIITYTSKMYKNIYGSFVTFDKKMEPRDK